MGNRDGGQGRCSQQPWAPAPPSAGEINLLAFPKLVSALFTYSETCKHSLALVPWATHCLAGSVSVSTVMCADWGELSAHEARGGETGLRASRLSPSACSPCRPQAQGLMGKARGQQAPRPLAASPGSSTPEGGEGTAAGGPWDLALGLIFVGCPALSAPALC